MVDVEHDLGCQTGPGCPAKWNLQQQQRLHGTEERQEACGMSRLKLPAKLCLVWPCRRQDVECCPKFRFISAGVSWDVHHMGFGADALKV